MSLNKRFQLGEGGNNHNCNFGFGGWFGWEGVLNGEDVMGFSGDVIADIDEGVGLKRTAAASLWNTRSLREHSDIERPSTSLSASSATTPRFQRSSLPICVLQLTPRTLELERHHGCNFDDIGIIPPCLVWTFTDNCPNWDPQYDGCNEPVVSLVARWNTPKRSSKATALATSRFSAIGWPRTVRQLHGVPRRSSR